MKFFEKIKNWCKNLFQKNQIEQVNDESEISETNSNLFEYTIENFKIVYNKIFINDIYQYAFIIYKDDKEIDSIDNTRLFNSINEITYESTITLFSIFSKDEELAKKYVFKEVFDSIYVTLSEELEKF